MSRLSYSPSTFAGSATSSPLSWFKAESFDVTLARIPLDSRTIILEIFSLAEVLVGQTERNALSAAKLAKLLGFWTFALPLAVSPSTKYGLWLEASEIFLELFKASLRVQKRLPTRLEEVVTKNESTHSTRRIRVLRIELETEGKGISTRARRPEELL
jgi:hypothetical protein